ncbi:MAG: acetyl-CoA carboxylase biotin carboxylase subunit [Bacteroidetes bacterium]|nr:MAG: acetyl-CoA carboxylase biotin carboxylase subunit [Bacteroidota bacterium]
MARIRRLLVANRGEIALRVMRTAHEMGITTVAVYSEADRNAPHVRFADEAYLLGPPPSSQSYLLGDKIIQLCLDKQIDAIHPGYGFLSENSAFARKVQAAGIIFIGPSPEAMDMMGDKISAKQAAKAFDVPLVPGLAHAITDIAEAKQVAHDIGFPVLIKASAGGGGKGMRVVENPEEFESQMERAVSEAISSFGDGSVFIEKFVTSPRHIEIQVLADQHGNVVYLFERECSIQRRHQKVVEEAPSAILTPELRRKMGEAAVNVCRACNYSNAGTVEFLMDHTHTFYFLEMNTRLQVEHPVSEMITGLDLVREQIRIAEGQPLSFTQEDLVIHGHAIEIRVCAEDPANNFLPDTGRLQVYRRPQGSGVRVDDGYEEGMDIPIYYDPLIAKLIVHAPTREAAMDRMVRAIDEYRIAGVQTTLEFCRFVMLHEAFRKGEFDTNFIRDYFTPEDLHRELSEEEAIAAALVAGASLDSTFALRQSESMHAFVPRSAWRLKRG